MLPAAAPRRILPVSPEAEPDVRRAAERTARHSGLHRRRIAQLVAFVVAGLLMALASGELSLVISR